MVKFDLWESPDFPAVTEDGLTGNSTIKALIRGLQIEAGVKVDGVLGSGSLAAIGTISPSLDTSVQTNRNKVYIAQGGLYCKGYNPKGFDGIYGSGMIEKVRNLKQMQVLYLLQEISHLNF